MAKFCDKCGNELKSENAKFCDKCGAEILANKNKSNVATTNMAGLIICPRCGQETPMGQAICAKCGSSLENNTAAVVVGYIVSILFSILGLIPGIYLLTRNNEKSKTQGIIICVFSILFMFMGFIFSASIMGLLFRFLLIIIFIVIGAILWSTK